MNHEMEDKTNEPKVILATDCGSTTSKARLFKKIGSEYRYVISGEAPTTVEAPYEDVTLGVRNAIREIEELAGHKLLAQEGIIVPYNGENEGVDLYVTTSSAGGGLQMIVSGVIRSMTAESAERAALGAGAIIMDIFSRDDGREPFEKIKKLRDLRPDMILIAGGTDGGNRTDIIEVCNFIKAADPKARFGAGYTLPIVYAGNKDAQNNVVNILNEKAALKLVDNIRPSLELENPEPARNAVHELFMEHVMSHAPGYNRLMKWTPVPIMPTPAGEGMMFRSYGEVYNMNVIGVGLGGATTNIYSLYDGRFVRSVSANLGMSYSICNVLKEAGVENVRRWLPFEVPDLTNELYNKMIRPTTIPQDLQDLVIEQAVAREALRLGFQHHKSLARPLLGARVADQGLQKWAEQSRETRGREETYIDMLHVNSVGGTGGLLSHAPREVQAALLLMDGFQVAGVTELFKDSVFMMPHLGVMSTVQKEAAVEIFDKDCIVRLATCIAFQGQANRSGDDVGTVKITTPDGKTYDERIVYGAMKRVPLEVGQTVDVDIQPARGFDVGAGLGRKLTKKAYSGLLGIIIDARGRPLKLPIEEKERVAKLVEWYTELDAYPMKELKIGE
ncbi:MAG: hypothetical protein QG670_917 [Thermoproteota archaeon]|nr:hypothetical protein [Thermoproteota archaeon]